MIDRTYSKEEYNSEPIVYCPTCLSLKIRQLDEDTDYCDNCGSTDIKECNITEWSELYRSKYGSDYIKN